MGRLEDSNPAERTLAPVSTSVVLSSDRWNEIFRGVV